MKKVCFFCLFLLSSMPVLAGTSITAILLDTSKSVPPEDFRRSQEVVQQFVNAAGPNDRVLLYTFGNTLHQILPDELKYLQPRESNTMLFDAAYDAAQELDQEKADRKAIVIVSDGLDTKSATILEDTASYVNQRGIAIYGIGVGNVNRKTLERIAKLTGGRFFSIDTPGLAASLRKAQTSQKMAQAAGPLPPLPSPAPTAVPASRPAVKEPEPHPAAAPPPAAEPAKRTFNFLWVAGIGAGLILLVIIGWVLAQALKKEERTCPNCGRVLESYQTVCPSCPASTGRRKAGSPDSTQELLGGQEPADLVPVELLEKRPMTEEMLSKTFVLMEAPVLVIRKGKSVGQTFSLNRVYPVSIGRSRVNEIKLEDATISGQHCRIIPESGRHVLHDLGSTNGTFVNDKRVNKLVLSEGDVIRVGETEFLYKVEQQRT